MRSSANNQGLFRSAIILFAVVLICQAIWILSAEYFRSSFHGFPENEQAAKIAAANRETAALAASIGFIRGDLWAEYALTYFGLVETDGPDLDNGRLSILKERARKVIERALVLAPHNAGIWLLLAGVDARSKLLQQKAAAALRMSYYTGPNEPDLIPLRLRLAISSQALSDNDFQLLVRHDLRLIVDRKPELNRAIFSVYQHANPHGQQFLLESLKELDPVLATRLQQKK